jgi:hypothetical protein
MDNNNSTLEELRSLELSALDPTVRSSPGLLSRLLADDFIEFGSSGKIYDKQQIIDQLQSRSSAEYSLTNLQVELLSSSIALVTYRCFRSSQIDRGKNISLRSSIWRKGNESWQMVFHQGTLIER